MLGRILAFFDQTEPSVESFTVDEAAAVLLIEVMLADHDVDQRETDCIVSILKQRMKVSDAEAKACIEMALTQQQQSHDLFQFTRVINDQYSEDERFQLIVDLWRVAFADDQLDKYEDHRIRRVSELLHLHHSHFIRAKAAAKKIIKLHK